MKKSVEAREEAMLHSGEASQCCCWGGGRCPKVLVVGRRTNGV
jgi:hypothetical protein